LSNAAGCGRICRPQPRDGAGYTLVELLFVLGLIAVVGAIAVPQVLVTIDSSRALAAARYVSSRAMLARMLAVQRSAAVAIRFDTDVRGFRFALYQDGNQNGVLAKDIVANVDRQLEQPVRLFELFPGVDFALTVDGQTSDPIQLSGTSLLTFTSAGTATSGSVYLRGRDGSQYAVRVLGVTGRTRILRYDARQQTWTERF
jgi:Tfp pilus assembly protein FimT